MCNVKIKLMNYEVLKNMNIETKDVKIKGLNLPLLMILILFTIFFIFIFWNRANILRVELIVGITFVFIFYGIFVRLISRNHLILNEKGISFRSSLFSKRSIFLHYKEIRKIAKKGNIIRIKSDKGLLAGGYFIIYGGIPERIKSIIDSLSIKSRQSRNNLEVERDKDEEAIFIKGIQFFPLVFTGFCSIFLFVGIFYVKNIFIHFSLFGKVISAILAIYFLGIFSSSLLNTLRNKMIFKEDGIWYESSFRWIKPIFISYRELKNIRIGSRTIIIEKENQFLENYWYMYSEKEHLKEVRRKWRIFSDQYKLK